MHSPLETAPSIHVQPGEIDPTTMKPSQAEDTELPSLRCTPKLMTATSLNIHVSKEGVSDYNGVLNNVLGSYFAYYAGAAVVPATRTEGRARSHRSGRQSVRCHRRERHA